MATTSRGRRIPEATVARLPVYLRILLDQSESGTSNVSSEELADLAGVNAAKVRKDLSYLGTYGTRGVGYEVEYLIYQVRRELGLTHDWPVVIVGAGNLGQALAGYGGCSNRVSIGVVATPAGAAQEAADLLVAAGVTSILNFAPVVLTAPPGVNVRKVDLAVELQILSYYEQRRSAAAGPPLQAIPAGSRRGASA